MQHTALSNNWAPPSSPTERAEGHTLMTISYFGLRFIHSLNINEDKLL